jgi:transposase-like protein
LIRNSFRLVPRQQWDALRKDLKLIYTAPTPDAAAIALEELDEKWGRRYGALIRL